MSPANLDAAIFDLDGVLTDTAALHARAWGETFDAFLQEHSASTGTAFRAFDRLGDYLGYVDGKPRYRGVAAFLASRGITLPEGEPTDSPDRQTVCGVGNRKNLEFQRIVQAEGVSVYEDALSLLETLEGSGVALAVVTSSRNGRPILAAAGLSDRLSTVIDGEVARELRLEGKPHPDTFLAAARTLGVSPDRCLVIEDALSGVEAAVRGGFGLVVGVARLGTEAALRSAGADLTVRNLAELTGERMEGWFEHGRQESAWNLYRHGFSPATEKHLETLLTVGNGYFASRGAAEEGAADEVHYPGTYLAGVYNRLTSEVAGRAVENEDLVNCPSWLAVRFRVDDGPWVRPGEVEIVDLDRRLELRTGLLHRELTIRDREGRESRIRSIRLASMADPHQAALRYRLQPLNYRGRITLGSGLDAGVSNRGVERYRSLRGQHLRVGERGGATGRLFVAARTSESGVEIALGAHHRFSAGSGEHSPVATAVEETAVYSEVTADLGPGDFLQVDKSVVLCTSLDDGEEPPLTRVRRQAEELPGFEAMSAASEAAWQELWEQIDIRIDGDRYVQRILRLHAYHLLVAVGPHHLRLDAGIPARGLHGEAYRGHIFWDEAFALPYYVLQLPETARSALLYRYRRLERARRDAAAAGQRGAMYPWQSGRDGREETQTLHLNPRSGRWHPDHSHRQRHVSLAIAYGAWIYGHVSGDEEFLLGPGLELMTEIARFWAGLATPHQKTGRLSIAGVMGPDEFHEGYPGAAEGGLADNAYTNLMVAWLWRTVADLVETRGSAATEGLRRLGVETAELEAWREMARRLRVVVSGEGILAQFDGFLELPELDWEGLRSEIGSVARLDRILKARGDSPDRYQAIKQADALMPFFFLSPDVVGALLEDLGIEWSGDHLQRNFDYYFARTTHGSTLSTLVHGYLADLLGRRELARELFLQTLETDLRDVQGGTTGEGIHLAAMAGSVLWVLTRYAGLDFRRQRLQIDPELPPGWRGLGCRFRYRGCRLGLEVSADEVRLELLDGPGTEVELLGRSTRLGAGEVLRVATKEASRG